MGMVSSSQTSICLSSYSSSLSLILFVGCSEPCIRGHRSSKCDHFDRLMLKVPRAGRPLAKCPHLSNTCSCKKTYAFMIRIPKGKELRYYLSSHEILYHSSKACKCSVTRAIRIFLCLSPAIRSTVQRYRFERVDAGFLHKPT